MSTIADLRIGVGIKDKTDKGLSSIGDKVGKAADGMVRAGEKMSTRVTLPLVGAGVAAFSMASDVDEALAQTEQVFGKEAAGIVKASENMNDAFSQEQFLSYAGNIGDITQGIGIAKEESDEWAESILQMGQDIGSFKNEDPTRVIESITSALTGEREQLKGLGIVINEAMVTQKAMNMGLADAEGNLDQAAKAQATMALITEKSKNAIGDFDRTSDGAANKTRILAGNFKDSAAALGKELLPMGTQLLEMVGDWVKKFQDLSPEAKTWIVRIGGMVAAVGPVLLIGGKLIKTFGAVGKAFGVLSKLVMANPWVALIAGTIALVTLIVMNWDTIVDFLKGVWEWIKNTAGAVWDFLKGVFQAGMDFIKDLFFKFTPLGFLIKNFDKIKEAVTGVWSWIKTKFQAAVDFVKDLFLNFTPLGLFIKHMDSIKEAVTGVKDWISDRIDDVVGFFREMPGRISRVISGAWDGLKTAFRNAINWIIRKWNNFSISIKLPAILGGQTLRIDTPNIPTFHEGGVVPQVPGGEMLALLESGETVTPADKARPGPQVAVHGDVYGWDDFVKKVREAGVDIDRLGLA